MQFNDWSAHLQQVQLHVKNVENKLLHRKYNSINDHFAAIKTALDKTQAWLATHGQNAGVDLIPLLEKHLQSVPESDLSRPYLMAAIQEIEQLRGERQFWLKAGYSLKEKND